jgi:hypothetical protein
MLGRFAVLALTFCCAILASGCTKKKTSAISFSLPQHISKGGVGTLSTDPYQHIAINISGPGIDTIVDGWDSHNCKDTATACIPTLTYTYDNLPTNVELGVQVLVVTGTDHLMTGFWYADSKTTLTGTSDTPVALVIKQYGSTSSINSAQLIGRYYGYAADGTTVINPSGPILGRIPPPPDAKVKAPIIVVKGEMYAGWFQIFGLQEIGLVYEMPGIGTLFPSPVQLTSVTPETGNINLSPTTGVMNVEVPQLYQTWDGRQDSETSVYLGKFGPAAVSTPANALSICMPDYSGSPYSYHNKVKVNPLGILTYPSGSISSAGGSGSACSGTIFTNYLPFLPEAHDNSGLEKAGGFKGPFTMFPSASGGGTWWTNVDIDTTTYSPATRFDWHYLPGVDSTVIDGVTIWIRSMDLYGDNRDYESSDGGVKCGSLGSLNFTALNGGAAIAVGTTFYQEDISSYGNAKIILCPVKAGKVLTSAVETNVGNFGGGGQSLANADHLVVVGPATIAMNVCTPFRVEGRVGTGTTKGRLNASVTLNSSDSTDAKIYTSDFCGTDVTGSSIPAENNGDRATFYIKATSTGSFTLSLSGTGYTALNKTISRVNAPSGGSIVPKLVFEGPSGTISAFQCYEGSATQFDNVTGLILDANVGYPHVPPEFIVYPINASGAPCENTPLGSNMLMFSSKPSMRFNFKYTGTSKTPSLTGVWTSPPPPAGLVLVPKVLNVSLPGPFQHLSLQANSNSTVNICVPVYVVPQDRAGNPTKMPFASTLTLDDLSGGGTYFLNYYGYNSCSSSTTTLTFAVGEGPKIIGYQPANPGSTVISAIDVSATPMVLGLSSLTVQLPPATMITAVANGMSYVDGSAPTGPASSFAASANWDVDFYAVRPDYTKDTNFNSDPLSSSNFVVSGLPTISFPSGNQFVSGHLMVRFSGASFPSAVQITDIGAHPSGPGGGTTIHIDTPLATSTSGP